MEDQLKSLVSENCQSFLADSPNRKPEFRLDISILQQPNGTFLVKTPAQKEAEAFVRILKHREQLACSFFSGNMSVVQGECVGSGIRYPLLPYPSLEKVIGDELRRGDRQAALSIVSRYLSLLQSLRTRAVEPTEFLHFIGHHRTWTGDKVLCFLAGPIDLIPGNILIHGDSYYIIDNEWFFEFPVPFDFVVYRGLASLVFRLQDDIRANAKWSPITPFSGRWRNRAYIPITWAQVLAGLKLPLDTLNCWNSAFQQKVLIRSPAYRLRLNSSRFGPKGNAKFAHRSATNVNRRLRNCYYYTGRLASRWNKLLQELRAKFRPPD